MNGSTGRWVGIDVAKSKLDVDLLDERGKFKNHVFANDAKGHALLIAWLLDRAGAATQVRVCMEATGPYGEACATALADAGFVVSVVNPARVKGFAQSELVRNKTDRADASLLARFGQTMQPEPLGQRIRCSDEGRWLSTEGRHRCMHAQARAAGLWHPQVETTVQSKLRSKSA